MVDGDDGVRRRRGARVLLLDPDDRVLSIKVEDASIVNPARLHGPTFWITVGGGLEPGEDFSAAARREVAEETGVTAFVLGPVVWERDVRVTVDGEPVHAEERYFAGRADRSAISVAGLTDAERAVFREHRWWTHEDLSAEHGETLVPEELVDVVARAIVAMRPPG